MSLSQYSMNVSCNTPDRKVVLVIEDSPTQAIIVQELLSDMGLHALTALSGMAGIRTAHQVRPALIILDVQMPDIDGFEVCAHLKKYPETRDIPVIMFTRQNSPEAIRHGIEIGAVEFIPKDAFANAVLIETLRQMGLVGPDQSISMRMGNSFA